jgi:hypothetical protein
VHQTPRIRVLSDRIPRVLLFLYFCRGLSDNMEKRPTCRINDGIMTEHVIILHLEESRSHGNKRETERSPGQGARPSP